MPPKRGTFRYAGDPLFLASLALYAVNRLLIKPHLAHYSAFFHGHFDDCLLVPGVLPLFLLVFRQLRLRPDDEPPRWWEIALNVAVWIVWFKWFGPHVLHRSVADPVDALCYALGGVVAWAIWNWPRRMAPSAIASAPMSEM